MSNDVDSIPDIGDVPVVRSIVGPTDPAPDVTLPEGAATAPATSPAKRRTPLAVSIVVGLLVVAGSWWATSALLGLQTGGAAQADGYTYSSSEVGYEVTFPGVPDVTSAPLPNAHVDLEETTVTWSNESAVYSVATIEWPADVVAGVDRILEDLLYGLRTSIPGEELREKTEGSLDGEPALSGMIASDDEDIWFTVAMHGNTQVILTLAVPTGEPAPTFAETFRFID